MFLFSHKIFFWSLKHSVQDNELAIGSSLMKLSFFQGHKGASKEFFCFWRYDITLLKFNPRSWYHVLIVLNTEVMVRPTMVKRVQWFRTYDYIIEIYFSQTQKMWRASTYNPISAVLEIKFLVSSFFLTFCNAIMKFAWAAPGKMPALCGNQIKGRKWGLFRQFSAIQS